MTRAQIDRLTRRYLEATFEEIEERLALDWSDAGRDAHVFDLNDEAHMLGGMLASGDYGDFTAQAAALLPDAETETQRKLARRLIETKLDATAAEIKAFRGEPLRRPTQGDTSGATEGEPKDSPPVSEAARLYGDQRVQLRAWSPKTEKLHRSIFDALAELLGDPPIGEVTKADMRQLAADLVNLPANVTKKYPGVGLKAAIVATEGKPEVARLEPRSVNKYQQLTRSLFAWALENEIIGSSPATVLKDVKERRATEDRKPFTDADLAAYFAEIDREPERPELYWIARILAYSGMRLNEAAQLKGTDIRMENGVVVFDVNEDDEGKKLKTEASRRLVPVHPELVRMGLLAFAERRKGRHIIDARWRTTPNPERGPVDRLSRLLNRRLREAGVDDKRKTGAHSFRHTVSARLKAASVPEYQIAEILGHENQSITTGRYGSTTEVAGLAKAMELLRLPTIGSGGEKK